MSKALRWGILGTGRIAAKFAGQLSQTTSGELVAVGSRSGPAAEDFAEQFAADAHPSYDELLADPRVEAVYISLPNALHHQWAVRALESGKHVLCEKPIAANLAQAEEMFAAAERAGRVLIEAFMYRCHPAVRQAIQLIREGTIGRVKLIRTHFTFNRPDDPEDVRYQAALAGGALMDVGCYCVNLARTLAGGEPIGMHACAHLHPSGVDDYAVGTLQFDGGTLCAFTCGMTVDADRTTFVCGSNGYLATEMPWLSGGTFHVFKQGDERTISQRSLIGHYALEAEAFAAAVHDEAEPFVSKADSLGNMRVLDELRRQAGVTIGPEVE